MVILWATIGWKPLDDQLSGACLTSWLMWAGVHQLTQPQG